MPYQLKKKSNGKVQLKLKSTGQVLAKNTTKSKALAQIKAIEMSKKRRKS